MSLPGNGKLAGNLRDLPPISAFAIRQSSRLGHESLLLAVPQSVLIEQGIHFFRNTIRQRRSLVRQINAARLRFTKPKWPAPISLGAWRCWQTGRVSLPFEKTAYRPNQCYFRH
jgi:hypothetical protein